MRLAGGGKYEDRSKGPILYIYYWLYIIIIILISELPLSISRSRMMEYNIFTGIHRFSNIMLNEIFHISIIMFG